MKELPNTKLFFLNTGSNSFQFSLQAGVLAQLGNWLNLTLSELLVTNDQENLHCFKSVVIYISAENGFKQVEMSLPHPAPATHPITNLTAANQTHPAVNPIDWEDTIAE